MPKTILPIAEGYYETDSLPISSQSCINMFPVLEEDDGALSLETLRATPGVTLVQADAEVPAFDPLAPPDVDSPHDPGGPTPPDPDAVPLNPDAPLPDKGPDDGEAPDGSKPDFSDNPECLPYSCVALDDYFSGSLTNFVFRVPTGDPLPAVPTYPLNTGHHQFESHREYRTPAMVADGFGSGGTSVRIPSLWRDLAGDLKIIPDEFANYANNFISPCNSENVYIPSTLSEAMNIGFGASTDKNLSVLIIQGPAHFPRPTINRHFFIEYCRLAVMEIRLREIYQEWFADSSGPPTLTSSGNITDLRLVPRIEMFSDLATLDLVFRAAGTRFGAIATSEILRIPWNDGLENDFHVVSASIKVVGSVGEEPNPLNPNISHLTQDIEFRVSARYFNATIGEWVTVDSVPTIITNTFTRGYVIPPPLSGYYTVNTGSQVSVYTHGVVLGNPITVDNYHSIAGIRTSTSHQSTHDAWLAWQRNRSTYTPPDYC